MGMMALHAPAALPALAEAASAAAANATVRLTGLPACATDCLAAAMPSPDAYWCAAPVSRSRVDKCLRAACPFPAALAARNVTESACGTSSSSKSAEFDAVNISLGIVTAFAIGTRLIYRYFFSDRRGLADPADCLVLLASPIALASLCVLIAGLSRHGLGTDIWTLSADELVSFGLFFFIMEVLYLTLLSLVKTALSVFYLEIFPGKTIRRLLWATIAFHVAFGVAFVFKSLFQCSPVRYNWQKYDTGNLSPDAGRCVDINAAGWVNATVNVAVDFWLVGIPLAQVRKLRLPWRKKIGASLMFMTGLLVTVVSILRLGSLPAYANTTNPTRDQYGISLWSAVEVNIGLICICLPTLRAAVVRIWPSFLALGSQDRSAGSAWRKASSRGGRPGQPAKHDEAEGPAAIKHEATSATELNAPASPAGKAAAGAVVRQEECGLRLSTSTDWRAEAGAREGGRLELGRW